jgi:hypothetical protein
MGVFVCTPDFFSARFKSPNTVPVALLLSAAVLAAGAAACRAQLVINELYYDHPGSDDGYEFVEIMNVSDAAVSLEGLEIQFHNGTGVGWEVLWSAGWGDVAPGGLFVVGGRFVTPAPDAVAGFSLQNGPDAVRLSLDGVSSDLLAYGSLDDEAYAEGQSAAGVGAGFSLARMPDGDDSDDNAADFSAADPSPGRFNVARFDAGIAVAGPTQRSAAIGADGVERLELQLTNHGQHEIAPASAALSLRDSTGSATTPLAQAQNATALPPGGGEVIELTVALSPGYHWLLVQIRFEADERRQNDSLTLLRRVGGPVLLVSEILCAPADGCPQFVELFNAGPSTVDIGGFKLRDRSHALSTVTSGTVRIPAGGYLAVTPDATSLIRCYPGAPAGGVIEHGGTWPTLNRSGSGGVADSVVVADALGLTVEGVCYPPVGSEFTGRSLERVDLYPGRSTQTWVLSPDPTGASPGRGGGRSLFDPPAPGSMEVTPRTFSPWNGETMAVSVDAPPGTRVIVSVYDVEGRRLAELGAAIAFPAVFVWDGRHSGGRRLVPGLYLVVCESFSPSGERIATRKVVVGCARRGG